MFYFIPDKNKFYNTDLELTFASWWNWQIQDWTVAATSLHITVCNIEAITNFLQINTIRVNLVSVFNIGREVSRPELTTSILKVA